MTIFGWILGAIVLIVFVAWYGRSAYDEGDRDGFQRGKLAGRQEVDKWWVEMDSQLDEEWLKIWKEER